MRPEILTVPLPLILPTIVMLELIEETPRSRLASLVTAAQVKVLGCASVGFSLMQLSDHARRWRFYAQNHPDLAATAETEKSSSREVFPTDFLHCSFLTS